MSIKRKLTILAIAIYAAVFVWIFAQNLTVDTDYPYHLHSIWAINQGYLTLDPFINGGSSLTLAYGAPSLLLGSAIYPIFGGYTVAVLMLLAFPLFWYFSQRLFNRLTTERIAQFATFAALVNPLTIQFFLTAKLPFIWGVVFGIASLSFYLERKTTFAAVTGTLAVITHPLSIFLLAAILLLEFDLKRWLKPYLLTCSVVALQALFLFGVPGVGGGGGVYISIPQTAFLAAMLIILLFVAKGPRMPCTLSLLMLTGAVIMALVGVGIPTVYFDRIAWFILILAAPCFIKLALPRLKPIAISAAAFGIILLVPAVWARPTFAYFDNPSVYENLVADNQTLCGLRNGYVRYSGDGSAIYILPIAGVRFSNSGVEMHEFSLNDNAQRYYEQLLQENASFVLIYRMSPEENYLVQLNFPLMYSHDNLRIYEVPH